MKKILFSLLLIAPSAHAQNGFNIQYPNPAGVVVIAPAPAANNLERQLDFQLKQETIKGLQLQNHKAEADMWNQYLKPPQGVEANPSQNSGGFEIVDPYTGK